MLPPSLATAKCAKTTKVAVSTSTSTTSSRGTGGSAVASAYSSSNINRQPLYNHQAAMNNRNSSSGHANTSTAQKDTNSDSSFLPASCSNYTSTSIVSPDHHNSGAAGGGLQLRSTAAKKNKVCSENEHENDDDDNDSQSSNASDNSSLQDALASSSALVGENVLDSPITNCSRVRKNHMNRRNLERDSFDEDSLNSDGLEMEGGRLAAAAAAEVRRQSPAPHNLTTQQQQRQRNDDNNNNSNNNHHEVVSVGLMAQGLAWVQRQRERRQRLYLQNQAEQQLRKLRQELAGGTGTTSHHSNLDDELQQEQQQQHEQQHSKGLFERGFLSIASSAILGGASGGGSGDHLDDDTSPNSLFYNTGGGVNPYCGGSGDSVNSGDLVAAVVSQSGDGYTVNLPGVEGGDDGGDEDEEDDEAWIPPVRVHEPGLSKEITRNSAITASASPPSSIVDGLGAGSTSMQHPDDTGNNEYAETDLASISPPLLLSPVQMQQIAVHVLPRGISYCKWTRLYSLARDGDSFENCLRLVQGQKHTLMVIRTSSNELFGGFADQPWDKATSMQGSARFFGGPDSCLFKCNYNNNNNDTSKTTSSTKKNRLISFYKWTGMNRYIQLCDQHSKMLAFGGGGSGGNFGLSVEQDFQLGSSGHCDTFDNEPLCSSGETFTIVDMEIYGFLLGQF